MDRGIPPLGTWRINGVGGSAFVLTDQGIGFALLTAFLGLKTLDVRIQKPSDCAAVPPISDGCFIHPAGHSETEPAKESSLSNRTCRIPKVRRKARPTSRATTTFSPWGCCCRQARRLVGSKLPADHLDSMANGLERRRAKTKSTPWPRLPRQHVTSRLCVRSSVRSEQSVPTTPRDPPLGVPANRGSSKQSWYRIRRLSGQRQFHSAGDY